MAIKKTVITVYHDDNGQEYQFEPIEDSILPLEKTKNGYILKYLKHDEVAESPAGWDNTDCFLVYYHRSFWYPHEELTEDFLRAYANNDLDNPADKELAAEYEIIPVKVYIHSGVSLSIIDTRCNPSCFDSSIRGCVCIKKSAFKDFPDMNYKELAESLIKEWNMYLSGDVYCIVAETLDKDKKQIDYDIVGGYYGYEYAHEALKTDI
ncbi:MAG: hypothetical protein WC451_03330 [Patescibacteria group bacterium]|jgi:hypothetical protein